METILQRNVTATLTGRWSEERIMSRNRQSWALQRLEGQWTLWAIWHLRKMTLLPWQIRNVTSILSTLKSEGKTKEKYFFFYILYTQYICILQQEHKDAYTFLQTIISWVNKIIEDYLWFICKLEKWNARQRN